MLQLYVSQNCPYCRRVEAYMHEANIEYEELDIAKNPTYREILIEKGGLMQVPFLIDTNKEKHMYESVDIIEYLATHYAHAPKVEK